MSQVVAEGLLLAANPGPVKNVFGWVGCVMAWFLFLAPVPTMLKIHKTKTVGQFSDLPYLVSSLQCTMWSVYALPMITPDHLQPLITNVVGGLLEYVYVVVFIAYALPGQRWIILVKFGTVISFLGLLVTTALLIGPSLTFPEWMIKFSPPGASNVTILLGTECMVLNIVMYASPLAVVQTVIRLKSVEPMPLLLTVACGCCSASWTVYALMLPMDPFILIPNAAGLVLCAIQLTVYRCYSPFWTGGGGTYTPNVVVHDRFDSVVSVKSTEGTRSLLADQSAYSDEMRRAGQPSDIADVGGPLASNRPSTGATEEKQTTLGFLG